MPDKGARFFKCDFQVHSPRDAAWTGARPVTDAERLAYGRTLVAACKERGLGAIAVTDHHDLCLVRHVRQAAEEETDAEGKCIPVHERLVVFPGMELTLNVPCQALLIFDADFPADLFSLAMTALAVPVTPDHEAQAPQPVRLDGILTPRALKEKLDEHQFLRGRYIVFPNVSDGGGDTLLRQGATSKYAEMPWVGGYVDGSISRLGTGNRRIVDGKNPAYGNKRIALFQTSDSRRDDHRDLGAHATWVKWTTPTAEALRQACLAQESRVSQEVPSVPSRYVDGISVTNSLFMGPIDIDFNPQFNALIGGRGTGKSTILEYLRWGLCDQAPTAGDDMPRYERRRDNLVGDTLRKVEGRVEVRFRLNGIHHVVRRDSVSGSISLKAGGQEFRPCTEDELRAVLPIQAYSQKQLSSVSIRVDELVRFVTAPIQDRLARLDVQAEQAADKVRAAFDARRAGRKLARDIHRNDLSISSLRQQIDAVRGDMPGMSPEDQTAMDSAREYTVAEHAVAAWTRDVAGVGGEAGRLSASIGGLLAPPNYVPGHEELSMLATIERDYRDLLEQAKASLDAIVAYAGRFGMGRAAWTEWANAVAGQRERYSAALARHSANSKKVSQLADLEGRLGALLAEKTAWVQALKEHETAEADFGTARQSWRRLLDDRLTAFEQECGKLTEESGGAIRATLRRGADATAFVERFRLATSGSGLQRTRTEAIGKALAEAADPASLANEILADLERLADHEASRDGSGGLSGAPALARLGFTPNDIKRTADRLTPEDWIALALTLLGDVPAFSYMSREGEYIPFDNASAGQQATALLRTLLNQAGPPLLIDQPEEDLDNPVIHEVVQQIWSAKTRRQLIFASHNANLVVNGDAELVVWCDNRRQGDQSGGKVAGEGAIDVEHIRTAIKQVMEGGDRAFELRMRKYGF